MIKYDVFKTWVYEKDLLYKNFQVYNKVLREYFLKNVERSECCAKTNICQNFNTVLERCDSISYDEPGVPEAYIILHFLDRYHRVQITFM